MALTKALFAGDDPTPESVKRRMALAELLQREGSEYAHVDSPIEAIGSVLNSFGGAFMQRRAEADEKAGLGRRRDAQQSLAQMLIGNVGGGGSFSSGMTSAMPSASMASTGPAAASPGGGARAAAETKSAAGEDYVMNYLIGKGLAPHQAAGFTGNLIQESSLNTGARNPGDGRDGSDSIGIAQWNGDRARNYAAFAKGTGREIGNIDAQLDFTLHEMGLGNQEWRNLPGWGSEGTAGRALRSANDVAGAAAAGISYERPAGWSSANPTGGHGWANRYGHAQRLAGGNWGPPTTTSAPAPVQVASNDPTAGVAAATTPVPQARQSPTNAQGYATEPPTVPPQPAGNVQQMGQLLTQGAPPMAPSMTGGVSQERIAQLLADPYTEDLGQQLLQQMLSDRQKQAEAQAAWQRDVYKTQEGRQYERMTLQEQRAYDRMTEAEKRAYDDSVRREGYQREDEKTGYERGRQVVRDNVADRNAEAQLVPSDVRAYNYYAEQERAAGREPLPFLEYQNSGRRAGANSVTVNSGEGDKFYENLDRKNAERFSLLSDGGQDARGRLATLDQLDTLLKQSPSGAEARVKLWLGDLGVNTDGVEGLQATRALVEKMVPQQREPGSGPMSDADLLGFRRSLPTALNQPGGNDLIIGTAKSIAQYDIQRGEIADMVADRAITPAEGRKRLRELKNPLEGFTDRVRELGAGKEPVVAQRPNIVPGSDAGQRYEDGVPVGGMSQAGTSAPAPVQIRSAEEFNALPPGTMFVAPDGTTRKKP